ncbi:hypothetical protein F0562_019938 [Nyssa sinensis]|uniref:Desiccation-related protein PCC13-62 n=1 Tax=Nyssa sinensis TaxID=561372 RepID=A0A5J5BPU3_9ASTE|nr:hypothetical protein F0562_019938 [Nyssa sinensis]
MAATSIVMLMMFCNFIHVCFSVIPTCQPTYPPNELPVYKEDVDLLQFAQNLEFSEAEFFLWGALGYGLDRIAPQQAMGGPPPVGVQKANLDSLTRNIITEFGYEEVGHLRILRETVGGIRRPLLNLSASNFAKLIDEAFGYALRPPFNPYGDSLSYMIASYLIPYMGLVGYVGSNPSLQGYQSKRLLAGLLGVESGQDAVIRMYLYERAEMVVSPYKITVAEFTIRISELRNKLAMCGIKDEGIRVPLALGAERKTKSNVLSANTDSISYSRTPAEILRVLYNSGNERVPGGFFPDGANGKIAKQFLQPR